MSSLVHAVGVSSVIFLFAGSVAHAQVRAEIGGTVLDTTEATIPNVEIVATELATGSKFSVISNQSGAYRVAFLQPGMYRVEASAAGFKKFVRTDLELLVGRVTRLDITMEVGEVTQEINVAAAAPVVEQDTASLSTIVEAPYVRDMPLLYRRPAQLIFLAPAVTYLSTDNRSYFNPFVSVAGNLQYSNQYYIDGGNASNVRTEQQGLLDMNPAVDVIQEFRVVETNYKAEYGGGGGALILMTTKSGSNQLHGGVYEFLRNDVLDARNAFAVTKNTLRQNIYGATLGGPIKKDKTHFFASFEGTRQNIGFPEFRTVPTAAQKLGDFSQKLNAAGSPVRIFDPFSTVVDAGGIVTRTAFPGNRIPASQFDPVMSKIIKYYPDPNKTPVNAFGALNYGGEHKQILERSAFSARVDHQINSNNRIFGRALVDWPKFIDRGPYPDALQDADSADWRVPTNSHNYLAAWTRNLTPTTINEARFTYSKRLWGAKMPGSGKGYPAQFGLKLPAVNPDEIPPAPDTPAGPNNHFPRIVPENYDSLAAGFAGAGGYQKPMRNFHFIDTVSALKGSHTFKAGFEMRRSTSDYFYKPRSSGEYVFNSRPTASAPTDGSTGDGFASELLGWPASGSLLDIGERTLINWWTAVFVQDDWRIRRNLVLNAGVRYEYDTPMTELSDPPKIVGFDTKATNPVCNCPGVVTFPDRYHNPDRNNFGPRIGLAWSPGNGKTVVRTAYGVFYTVPYVSSIWTMPGASRPDVSRSLDVVTPDNGVTAPFLMRNGLPDITAYKQGDLNSGFGAVPIGSAARLAPDFFEDSRRQPYNQMATLTIQRELPNQILAEMGYIGNVGHKLNSSGLAINQVPIGKMGPGNAQVLRPFPQFSGVTILNQTANNSTYHALVTKLEKRFGGGLGFQANYTFSKFLDSLAQSNLYNRSVNKGLSNYQVRHRFVYSGVWETPFGVGRKLLNHGIGATVIGGWNVGGLVTLQSGRPITATMAQNLCNCFSSGAIRPNLIGNPQGPHTVKQWFNTAAFASPGAYAFGNAGVGIITPPGLVNVDLSLLKNFTFHDRYTAQLRAEFFNAFNHVNLNAPGTAFGSPTFGVISSAADPRIVQMGLKIEF